MAITAYRANKAAILSSNRFRTWNLHLHYEGGCPLCNEKVRDRTTHKLSKPVGIVWRWHVLRVQTMPKQCSHNPDMQHGHSLVPVL